VSPERQRRTGTGKQRTLALASDLEAGMHAVKFRNQQPVQTKEAQMNGDEQTLGLVERGKFQPLGAAPSGSVRLTRIPPQAGQPPESGELDLVEYEGSAIMVHGNNQGDWIYSAEVIDQATPIVTELVRRVFGASTPASP
jgi:hypothetical protein